MFLAPLLVDGASLLSEPVTSSIKMIAANWAALYSRGASFSFSIDTFFPLIRLLFARDYVLVVSLLHHPPTGSRLTFKLYRLRREQMQLRRIGSVVARFFPAKKIMELGEPSNEPYHEVILEAEVQGMPYSYLMDEDTIDLSARSLWTIRNAPSSQHPAVRIYAVWDPVMQTIVRRAFPQRTLAGLRAAFEDQVRLHELLHAWFRAKKQLYIDRPLYRNIYAFTRSRVDTEQILFEYAAHLGTIALGGMPDFHFMDLVTRLPIRNAAFLYGTNVMAARLITDLLERLPPSILHGKTYAWDGKVLMNQAEGITLLKEMAESTDSNVLRQELADAARRLYLESFGELPEWNPRAIAGHSTVPGNRPLVVAA